MCDIIQENIYDILHSSFQVMSFVLNFVEIFTIFVIDIQVHNTKKYYQTRNNQVFKKKWCL